MLPTYKRKVYQICFLMRNIVPINHPYKENTQSAWNPKTSALNSLSTLLLIIAQSKREDKN